MQLQGSSFIHLPQSLDMILEVPQLFLPLSADALWHVIVACFLAYLISATTDQHQKPPGTLVDLGYPLGSHGVL